MEFIDLSPSFPLGRAPGGKKVIGLRQPSRGGDKVSLVMASMVDMAGPRYSHDGAQPIQAYPILCWVRRGLLLGWAAEQTLVICSLHGLFLGKTEMKHRIAFVPTRWPASCRLEACRHLEARRDRPSCCGRLWTVVGGCGRCSCVAAREGHGRRAGPMVQ